MKTKHGTVLRIVALMIVAASVHSTVAAESRGRERLTIRTESRRPRPYLE